MTIGHENLLQRESGAGQDIASAKPELLVVDDDPDILRIVIEPGSVCPEFVETENILADTPTPHRGKIDIVEPARVR